jgi:hypothetical protein
MKEFIKKLLREGLLTKSKFEYQVRDIGGADVYYRRTIGGKIWDFIDKEEFDKKSNKGNIVKYKK